MISIIIISKDESALDKTIADVTDQTKTLTEPSELIVVDASDGRLDHIRLRYESEARWLQFSKPAGVRITIPHQRNAGVRAALGEIIVFTDAGCCPDNEWLANLVAPIFKGEHVTAGLALSTPGGTGLYDHAVQRALKERYLTECPTINLAFRREAFDAVGGFDEEFAYGSDVDFTWRLIDAGYKIRSVPGAVVRHDWGSWRRQLRRSYVYGKARARLYRKHHGRLRHILRDDPVAVIYPLFLLGLPLTFSLPIYPALLLVPAWRNRSNGPIRVVIDHLSYGAGVIAELVE